MRIAVSCHYCRLYTCDLRCLGLGYLLTYLLTTWSRVLLEKLTGLQLVKKFPAFLWNPKFHYRTHKLPPPVPILGQPNPVHIPTSHLLEIHPNIIHPSTPRSPQWSLSLRFPHQYPICPPLLTHTRMEAYKWKINTQINISAVAHLYQKKTLRTHFGFSLYCIQEHTLVAHSFLLSKGRLSFLRILKIAQGGDTNTFQTVCHTENYRHL